MSDPRGWIKVSTGFASHPKTLELSDRAFRCLISLWCYAGAQETDGFLSEKSVKNFAKPKDFRELLETNFLEKTEKNGVYYLHDWGNHQATKAERRAAAERAENTRRQGGTLSSHNRWHVARGVVNPSCPHCSELSGAI